MTHAMSTYQPSNKGNIFDIATRAQIVTLKRYTNMTSDQISAITGVQPQQIVQYNKTASDRGYEAGPLTAKYLEDSPRTERTKKADIANIGDSTLGNGSGLKT